MSIQRTIPDRFAAGVACFLLGVLAAGCSTPTGPAVDREAEKRKSFTREELPGPQWQEAEIVLPAFPRAEDLVEVEISGPRTFTFLVDANSVSVDDDGVVRYSMIARSTAGAENVSFEGMRCETNEYKAYAFGSQDRTWSRVSGSWLPIREQQSNNGRFALARYYFCPYSIPQPSSEKAVAALKHGIPHPSGR